MGQEYCGRRIGHGGPWLNNNNIFAAKKKEKKKAKRKYSKYETAFLFPSLDASRVSFIHKRALPRVEKKNKQSNERRPVLLSSV